MAASKRPEYVIEHMEEDDPDAPSVFPEWALLEYRHMLSLVGPGSTVHFTSLSSASLDSLRDALATSTSEPRAAFELHTASSLTEVQPATLPPFRQRQARLAHPSTPKLVHLTVFLDPAEFAPQVGSAVLLLGVKNHRFDGGSLKKYSSDRPRDGGPWWLEDPAHLPWCDVDGLTRWWDLRLR